MTDEEIADAAVRPILRFARRAISPRAPFCALIILWSFWEFGAGRASFIALATYLFIVTETCRVLTQVIVFVVFVAATARWLGFHLPPLL